MQHDVDIISDKEISIFNNNNSVLKNSKFSEVVVYNFETNTFSKKFNQQLQNENFKTKYQGLAEILKDSSMLIEESLHGRLILFNKDGEKEWEFVNKDKKGDIYFISWSRIIEDIDFITEGLVIGQDYNDDVRVILFVTTNLNNSLLDSTATSKGQLSER